MHILGPLLGIHVQRPYGAVVKDLGEVRVPVARKAFLVGIFMYVGRGVEANGESKKAKEKQVNRPRFNHHLQ
jgi:hypothetical protein